MKVAMIGLGKLGLPCAEMMARAHDVVGYDVSPRSAPFPVASTIAEAVDGAQIVFVAVPTPHDPAYGGEKPTSHLPVKDFDYGIVEGVLRELAGVVGNGQIVVLISTVLPGTVRSRLAPLLPRGARLVYNPYLIAMGTVAWDMVNPEMIMIGTHDGDLTAEGKVLRDFYAVFMENDPRVEIGTWEEIESLKVFYNTYISAKIGLVNMIQDVAEKVGNMNVDVVTQALAKSTQRIMGPKYMTAGMGDGGACLHPETPIFTKNGIIKIENIEVGDSVLTHSGRFRRVLSVWKNKHSVEGNPFDGDLLCLKAEGRLATFVTPDHKIFAATDQRKKYTTGGIERRVTTHRNPSDTASDPIEIRAGDLRPGDHYLLMPRQTEEIMLPDHVSNSYLLLAGYYISEGSIDRSGRGQSRISFHLHRDEEDYSSEIKDSITKISPDTYISERIYKNRRDIRISNDALAKHLEKDFGRGAANKNLPAWALYGNFDTVRLLLRGAFRGDGHTSTTGFSYSTISEKLAIGMQFLLARGGISASLQEHPRRVGEDGTKHQHSFEVRIRNAIFVEAVAELTGMSNLHQMQDKRYRHKGFVKDGMVFSKLKKSIPVRYVGDVYDLEVEDDHTYITPMGYVSNCHPRDNVALSDLSARLDLGYDLFGAIMHAREMQAKKMAEALLRHGRRVVVVGKAYKPGVAYVEGSYSLLVGHYVTELGGEVHYVDAHTGDDSNPDGPNVYLIGYWDTWTDDVVFNPGSTVVDPWRRFEARGRDVAVVHYGNTRPT